MLDIHTRTNDLIPILISKFDSHSKNMKNRIKINSIFAEFDLKTRNQLNEFIQMSHSRYKGVKIGNELQNIISNQKLAYNKISDKIFNDYFYRTHEIDIENKKLFKTADSKKNNEINEIRDKIKQDTKDYSKYEIKTRERLLRQVEKKRKREKTKNQLQSRLNYAYIPRFNFENEKHHRDLPLSHEENEVENEENRATIPLEEKKKYFDDIMNEDEEKFKSYIGGYCNYIKEFGSSYERGEVPKVAHKFNFHIDDVKMLSYKEEGPATIVVKKKEDHQLDIMKLLKYTKKGKSSKFYSFSPSNHSEHTKGEKTKAVSSMSKTGSDFRSTRMTVKSEAEKAITIDEVFAKKRETMDNCFKYASLPGTNDYEELIRVRSGILSQNWKTPLSEIPIESKKLTSDGASKRNIIKCFRRAYTNKASKWKNEDEQVELKKLNDIKKKKEISVFLKQIKQLSRQPQYYVDGYSKKDDLINQRISQFNQSLNSVFHSKKAIEKKAIRFNSTHQSNSVRKATSTSLKRTEKMQLKEGNEVSRIINQNLQCGEETEDINLNYQVFAQRIEGRNNEQKADPYREFLDFKAQVASKGSIVPIPSIDNNQGSGSGLNSKSIRRTANNFEVLSSPFIAQKVKSPPITDLNENYLENSIFNDNDNENKDMKYILVEKIKEVN